MAYRKGMGHNSGSTRLIRVLTIVFVVFYSCLMLSAQINGAIFIQCKAGDCIVDIARCMVLFGGYVVCFAPITVCWIVDGFKQDKYL